VGVLIGIEESSSRARISRYELGVHEPPVATSRLLASALGVPLAYLYCDEDDTAALLLALNEMSPSARTLEARKLLSALPLNSAG
jgi:transcriptional regulator with XRE-family HTH domain